MPGKRLGLDISDLLVLVGAVLVAVALWSLAWQLCAVVYGLAAIGLGWRRG